MIVILFWKGSPTIRPNKRKEDEMDKKLKGKVYLIIVIILIIISGVLLFGNIISERFDFLKYAPTVVLFIWLVVVKYIKSHKTQKFGY